MSAEEKKKRRGRPLLVASAGLAAVAMGCYPLTSGNLVAYPCNPDGSYEDCVEPDAGNPGGADAGDAGDAGDDGGQTDGGSTDGGDGGS